MKFLLLYFLFGAIIAIWTSINQNKIEQVSKIHKKNTGIPYLFAYTLIAMAWPVSVVISIYTLIETIFASEI